MKRDSRSKERLERCYLCGHGNAYITKSLIVLGDEVAGFLKKLGKNNSGLQAGDAVTLALLVQTNKVTLSSSHSPSEQVTIAVDPTLDSTVSQVTQDGQYAPKE